MFKVKEMIGLQEVIQCVLLRQSCPGLCSCLFSILCWLITVMVRDGSGEEERGSSFKVEEKSVEKRDSM